MFFEFCKLNQAKIMKRTFSDQPGNCCLFFTFSGDRSVLFSNDASQQDRRSDRISNAFPLIATLKTIFIGVCFSCFACFFTFTNSAFSGEFAEISQEKTAQSLRITKTLLAMQDARRAVVNIEGDREQVKDMNNPDDVVGKAYNGMGTGMMIDPRGYIVTNYHVIEGIRKLKVKTLEQANRTGEEDEYYVGTLIARDHVTDLAIIKINGKEPFTTIKLGISSEILWGEDAYAIGNPYGWPFTITRGIISGLARDVEVNEKLTYTKAIQTDVAINPGNSGGPLLNADGEVVGMNAAIRTGAENIAFAIPIDQVVEVAARLIIQHSNRTVYHGIHLKKSDDLKKIIIESVDPGSPAEMCGLQTNDQLVAENTGGNQIEFQRTLDFARLLLEKRSSEALNLIFTRDSEHFETNLQLVAAKPKYYPRMQQQQQMLAANAQKNGVGNRLPNVSAVAPKVGEQMTQARLRENRAWEYLGIKFTTIPIDVYKRQYKQYLDDYPYGAIRVSYVRPNSPMFQGLIEPGDMILAIDEKPSHNEASVDTIISELQKNAKSKKIVKVMLNRPRAYDGLPPDGYFEADMSLP